MNILLKALGCRLNEAELEQWARVFRSYNHQIVTDADEADIIILNSCAVTSDAGKKSRQLINRLYRTNPEAHIVVTGCYASLNLEEVAQTMGVDLVVSNADKDNLPKLVLEKFAVRTMPLIAMEPGATSLYLRGRNRAFIKIQDGCRYRCTYCIVTVARGDERSRSEQDIIAEINDFHEQGIQEIVLTGVHVGGYGSDLSSSLTHLVQSILQNTDIPRVRFASVEPWDLPDDFFGLFADPRLMPHMHLPIQSGADSVLRRMSRRCKTKEFKTLVELARQSVSGFNVTTDIIVGFPGETDTEWHNTMEYIESIGFGHMHVFSYSAREGTKAAGLANPVPNAIKKERSLQMRQLGDRMKADFYSSLVGFEAEVLWEKGRSNENSELVFHGYTPNYVKVQTVIADKNDAKDSLENTITSVQIQQYEAKNSVVHGIVHEPAHRDVQQ
ncbi:MAG: tRNA (N(6)-L-threonylcarbamoyladenosine(37)-C(2))-methylthiotransferase MtaB [Thiotrichaceae bacterium]